MPAKRFLFVFFLSLLALYGISIARLGGLGKIDGQDATGSPFTNNSCANCHSSGIFSPNISLSVLDAITLTPVFTYLPSGDYLLEFSLMPNSGSPAGYGLQAVGLLDNGTNGGMMGAPLTPNTQITVLGNRQYLEHSGLNTAGIFTTAWSAPAQGTGDVTFYFSGIAANGDNTSNQDDAAPEVIFVLPEACIPPLADFSFTAVNSTAFFSNTSTGLFSSSKWTFGDGSSSTSFNPTHVYSAPGAYNVCLIMTGCAKDTICKTVIVGCPLLNINTISTQNPVCPGGTSGAISLSTSGGLGPYSYSWSNGNTGASATGLGAGTYSVNVSDQSGCTGTKQFSLTDPPGMIITVSESPVSCAGGSNGSAISMVSGGAFPYQYLWSTGSTDPFIQFVTAGSYPVTITDANGCVQNDTAIIFEPPAVVIQFNTTDVACNGDSSGSVSANATGGKAPYLFLWSTGSVSPVLSGLPAGLYGLKVTDKAGCIFEDSVAVHEPLPLSFSFMVTDETSGNDGALDLSLTGGTPPYMYLWETGDSTQDLIGLAAGTYTVWVTDSAGCTGTDSATVGSGLSIAEPGFDREWQFFPNPARDFILVRQPKPASYLLRLYDLQGREILVFRGEGPLERISLPKLPAGLYRLYREGNPGSSFLQVQ